MNIFPALDSKQLYVVLGQQATTKRLLKLGALLATGGVLHLLDCGNRANPYPLARELCRLTNDPVQALQNIRTARAFTCYQVVVLLEQTAERASKPRPVLIFDLLDTFYDENVRYAESRRLLEIALKTIQALKSSAPVVVSARPLLPISTQRGAYLKQLCKIADVVWEEPGAAAGPRQLALFPIRPEG